MGARGGARGRGGTSRTCPPETSSGNGIACMFLDVSTRVRMHGVVHDAGRDRVEPAGCRLSLRRRGRCDVVGTENRKRGQRKGC